MNLNSNVRNTENSELNLYCQKEMLSLLHQFPFEYVTHSNINKSLITIRRGLFMNSVFVNPGIVASLITVVIVSGIFFNYISIRYNMLL